MVGTGAPSETFGACVARIRNKTVLARNYSVALHSVFSLFENVNTHIHTDMEELKHIKHEHVNIEHSGVLLVMLVRSFHFFLQLKQNITSNLETNAGGQQARRGVRFTIKTSNVVAQVKVSR